MNLINSPNLKLKSLLMNRKVNKKTFNKYRKKQIRKDKKQDKKIKKLKNQFTKFAKTKNLGNKNYNFVIPYQKSYDIKNYINSIKNYIRSLIYPEKYLNSGVKLPSEIGTYSFTYGFKEQFDFQTSQSGEFQLIWYPNFFSSTEITLSDIAIPGYPKITINGSDYPCGSCKRCLYNNSNPEIKEWTTTPSHQYGSGMEGYRLVSASIFIRYIGANIDKSGYIMAMPTYRNIPAFSGIGFLADTPTKYTINSLPLWTETNFVNTRGGSTKFTLAPNSTMKRIYVPIDPSDSIFEDPGYYYSSSVGSNQDNKSFNSWETAEQNGAVLNSGNSHLRILKPEDGNPLKYVFYGKGFINRDNTQNIHVETYYNFECIPCESIRLPNNDSHSKDEIISTHDKKVVLEEVAKEVDEGGGSSLNEDNIFGNIAGKLDKDIEVITNRVARTGKKVLNLYKLGKGVYNTYKKFKNIKTDL